MMTYKEPVSETPVVADFKQDKDLRELWLRLEAFLSLKSYNTQRTYRGIITEWCSFLGADAGSAEAASFILKATDLHAIAYRSWLEKKPGQNPRFSSNDKSKLKSLSTERRQSRRDGLQSTLTNSTIAKKFAALRRIYRMLIASGLGISQNPFDTDRAPAPAAGSGQKRPTEMVAFDKVKAIIALPDISTSKGLRDRAALALLFGGGLRRSEVVALHLGDVKYSSQGTLFVHLRATKAKRDADQALPKWAATCVEELCAKRIEEGAQAADPLLVSYRGKGGKYPGRDAISDSGLYKLFKAYCAKAGAGDLVTPHSARATAITKLLSSGIPHREVQEFSRHASVQMVEVYDKRRIGVDANPAKDLDYD